MKKIKPIDLDKLQTEVMAETDAEKIKQKTEKVNKRVQLLKEEVQSLLQQIEESREQGRKIEGKMLDGIRDRIRDTERIVATHNFPIEYEDRRKGVRQLTDRFKFLEDENEQFQQSYGLLDQTIDRYEEYLKAIEAEWMSNRKSDQDTMNQLKQEFAYYKKMEEEEIEKNKVLEAQHSRLVTLYQHIDQHIEECRKKYEVAETKANGLQRQLDQHIKDFQDRQNSDKKVLEDKKNMAHSLQNELLLIGTVANHMSDKKQELQIKEAEVLSHV